MNFFKIRIYFGFCDFLTFKSEYADSFRGVQNELITAGMSANKDIF